MTSNINKESSQLSSDIHERFKDLQIQGKRVNRFQEVQYHKRLEEERQNKERMQQHEKEKNYQQLLQYNPWGKPGGGAPSEMLRKQKLMESLINPKVQTTDVVDTFFTFGKPGHGAPQKTKSGRLRTQIRGDPSIRFQDVQNVHKSVENGIRYYEGQEAQQEYRKALDSLIKEKTEIMKQEMELKKEQELQHEKTYPFGRVSNRSKGLLRPMPVPDPIFVSTSSPNLHPYPIHNHNNSNGHLYDPWGKGFGTPTRDQFGNAIRLSPRWQSGMKTDDDKLEGLSIPFGKYSGGDGSPHIKDSSEVVTKLQRTLNKDGVKDFKISNEDNIFLNGSNDHSPRIRERRTFLEKLGWKEDVESSEQIERGKRLYLRYLKGAMEEANTSKKAQQNAAKEQSKEMALLMREKKVGCPSRHSTTGFISDDHKLRATDLTNRNTQSYSEEYKKTLAQQAEERYLATQKLKDLEFLETQKHFEVWDSIWQRPGHGAPNHPINHRKEGLYFLCKPPKKVHK